MRHKKKKIHSNQVILTNHGKKRLKERCGVGSGSATTFVQKVFDIGMCQKELTGNIKKYVSALYFYNQQANNIRIYGDKAYLFNRNVLITVYKIPEAYMESVRDSMREKKGRKKCTVLNVEKKQK